MSSQINLKYEAESAREKLVRQRFFGKNEKKAHCGSTSIAGGCGRELDERN